MPLRGLPPPPASPVEDAHLSSLGEAGGGGLMRSIKTEGADDAKRWRGRGKQAHGGSAGLGPLALEKLAEEAGGPAHVHGGGGEAREEAAGGFVFQRDGERGEDKGAQVAGG